MLAACGAADDAGDSAEQVAPAATTGRSDVANTATATSPATACRPVQHELGTACVPVAPQRIVTLDPLTALPTLLDLGAPVVASTTVYASGTLFQSYLDPAAVRRLSTIGPSTQPDLERILLAKPDLIVGWSHVIEPIHSQLEAIAPRVVAQASAHRRA